MKAIPEQPILDLLAAHREKGPMNCVELNKNSVMQAMPPGTSRFAAVSKMRRLVARGLVSTDLKGNFWLPNAPGRPAKPSGIKCFLIVPTGKMRRSLRRYVSRRVDDDDAEFIRCPDGYHNASVLLDVVEGREEAMPSGPDVARLYEGWPAFCGCGYAFQETDTYQVFTEDIYSRTDTGEEMTLREAPAGAIWRATWFEGVERLTGPDGHCYICRMPGGRDWNIDGPASNCDQRDRPHKCWVRTGEAPNLTVGKGKEGESCTAGAGSIWIDRGGPNDWHGFLTNGVLNHV